MRTPSPALYRGRGIWPDGSRRWYRCPRALRRHSRDSACRDAGLHPAKSRPVSTPTCHRRAPRFGGSAGKSATRPPSRGCRGSDRLGGVIGAEGNGRDALSAQSASGPSDARRPAIEFCGSPGLSGKRRCCLPCIQQNAVLRVGRLDEGRTDGAGGCARGDTGVCRAGWVGSCVRVGTGIRRAAALPGPLRRCSESRATRALPFPAERPRNGLRCSVALQGSSRLDRDHASVLGWVCAGVVLA